MVEVIRSVVRRELAAVRGPALGVVTALHSHAAGGDSANDEVDVTLQHEGVTLPKVPVAVAHPGTAVPVKPGDLVLVQFLGGDLQQPLVTGCFHTADDRPPVHADGEHVVEQRVDGQPRNRVHWLADTSVVLEHLDDQGTVTVTLELAAGGDVRLDAADRAVGITCGTLTVTGDVQVDDGNLTVSKGTVKASNAAGASTTIDGHRITGA